MTTRMLAGTRVRANLQLREPLEGDRDFVEMRTEHGPRVFIARRVLVDAESLTRNNVPDETGALLMGATFTDGRQPFTIVTDIIIPLPGEVIGTSATVTITATGRHRMEMEGRLRDRLASGVGWMHSHPIQQAFFSSTDRDEQSKWTGSASVGLVVSGREEAEPRYRVFLGPEADEAFDVTRFRLASLTRRWVVPPAGTPVHEAPASTVVRRLARRPSAPPEELQRQPAAAPVNGSPLPSVSERERRRERERRQLRRRQLVAAVISAAIALLVALAVVKFVFGSGTDAEVRLPSAPAITVPRPTSEGTGTSQAAPFEATQPAGSPSGPTPELSSAREGSGTAP